MAGLGDILERKAQRDREREQLPEALRALYEFEALQVAESFSALVRDRRIMPAKSDSRRGIISYQAIFMGRRPVGDTQRYVYVQPTTWLNNLYLEVHASEAPLDVTRHHFSSHRQTWIDNLWCSINEPAPTTRDLNNLREFGPVLEEVALAAAMVEE